MELAVDPSPHSTHRSSLHVADTAVDVSRDPTADEGGPGSRSVALRAVLDQLGEKVKPVVFARERTMPVAEPLRRVFPEGGLVRGRVMACRGTAAASIANVVVRDALAAGAWLAVIDIDTFGADAAAEIGVPLERIVRIDTGVDAGAATDLDWIDVMGAAVDGFDIVMTRVPVGLRGDRRPAAVRKLATRIQQRGALVVTLGDTGALACDIDLDTERTVWAGLGDGVGHLGRRQIDVAAGGRRLPGAQTVSLHLTGVDHRVEVTAHADEPVSERDPQAELLAEMIESAGLAGVADIADDGSPGGGVHGGIDGLRGGDDHRLVG